MKQTCDTELLVLSRRMSYLLSGKYFFQFLVSIMTQTFKNFIYRKKKATYSVDTFYSWRDNCMKMKSLPEH